MENITEFKGYYDFLFVELSDPRTLDWWLIKDPFGIFGIIGVYLFFVLKLGPWLMKDRKPMQLKNTLIVYNFFQVLLSVYLFVEASHYWLFQYSWRCQNVDFTINPESMRMATGCYVFFIAKITELLDTIFFVFRKKDNQISFLHVYHHTVMPLISWGCVKYFPGGHETFIGFVNSFVHIIMYFYYMMAAMGPQYTKYLWWKKYITTLQLGQFCAAFIHSSQLIFTTCGYPKFTLIFTMPNATFFYFLFSDFYNKAYKAPATDKSQNNQNETNQSKSIDESGTSENNGVGEKGRIEQNYVVEHIDKADSLTNQVINFRTKKEV